MGARLRLLFVRSQVAGAVAVLALGAMAASARSAVGPSAPIVIPVGPQGITYLPPVGEDEKWEGPSAMAVAPDGSVWIADVFGHRLVHYAADGAPLPPVDLEASGAWRIMALDVDADTLVALEVNPAAGVHRAHVLNHRGEFLASYDIPTGYHLQDGLTGLFRADDGGIVLELEGGHRLVQLIDAAGRQRVVELDGQVRGGRRYTVRRSGSQHAVVTAGEVQVSVTSDHLLGLVRFLDAAPGGGFYLLVEEVWLGDTIRVDVTVRHYGAAGELIASARRDLTSQFVHVPPDHAIDVGPDGQVYMLDTAADHVTVVRAVFVTDLPPLLPVSPVTRVAGSDRFATAIAVSRLLWEPGTATAVVATGGDFPDALAAGAVAVRHDAPLLLDGPGLLDELRHLEVTDVIVAGGHAAVPAATVEAIQELPSRPRVRRLAGPDRYATAAALAREAGAPAGVAALASGLRFPDAVTAGALLATPARPPVLLTPPDRLAAGTGDTLAALGITSAQILGGSAVVSDQVAADLHSRGVTAARLSGATRYDTSVAALARALAALPATPRPLVIATGDNFPDGLAAGAAVARLQGTLLLVSRQGLSATQWQFLHDHRDRFSRVVVVGGAAAVPEAVEQQLRDALYP